MKFSVIMPSRLDDYASAAKDREAKLIRAVNSVVAQTFPDWELNIVSDGCQKTVDLIQNNVTDERVRLWKIEQGKLWSGRPRNTGIEQANGEWITYLDIDDIYGENHLKIVSEGLNGFDWIWFNDIRYRNKLDYWYENYCDINQVGRHGTSNIAHKRSLEVFWDEKGKYSHDFYFVQKLLKFKNMAKITTPEYFVCHIPGTVNSGGYDK
jgi:glycosyltransferase involved in cell wall biosynthesis